jgi:hypothetical protein
MAKAKRFLDSVSDSMSAVYAEAAGGTPAQWRAVMVEETWYTSQEAVDANLASRVAVVPDEGATSTAGEEGEPPEPPDPDQVEGHFDLSIYAHAGRSQAPAPHKPPSASAVGSTPAQEGSPAVAFSDEQVTTMRQKLGVAENADEATILAALDEALEERVEPPAAPTQTNIPEGHVVIPAAKLEDLEAGARAGTDAAKALRTQEREAFLDANRTKYAPHNRDAWAKEYDRDPEGTRKHFDGAPEIVATTELGHGDEPDTAESVDAEVAAFADAFNLQIGA